MPRSPVVNSRTAKRALERAGFVYLRHHGSHAIYVNHETKKQTSVPESGGRDIKKPTLRDIIKQAGLTLEDFLKLLHD